MGRSQGEGRSRRQLCLSHRQGDPVGRGWQHCSGSGSLAASHFPEQQRSAEPIPRRGGHWGYFWTCLLLLPGVLFSLAAPRLRAALPSQPREKGKHRSLGREPVRGGFRSITRQGQAELQEPLRHSRETAPGHLPPGQPPPAPGVPFPQRFQQVQIRLQEDIVSPGRGALHRRRSRAMLQLQRTFAFYGHLSSLHRWHGGEASASTGTGKGNKHTPKRLTEASSSTQPQQPL